MPHITVDVDLDEFESYELIDELRRRIRRNKISRDEVIKELKLGSIDIAPDEVKIQSVDDLMRFELVVRAYNELTTSQLESLLEGKFKY